jgi:hypothetical protein
MFSVDCCLSAIFTSSSFEVCILSLSLTTHMNRGGGGERQHLFFYMRFLSWRRSGDRLRCAHVVASSEPWPAALRLPRFSPNKFQ